MKICYILDKYNCFAGIRIVAMDEEIERSVDIPPPEVPENKSARWTGVAWEVITDFRRTEVYNTADGTLSFVESPGDLPPNLTTIPRPSSNHQWDGKKWVILESKKIQVEHDRLNAEKLSKIHLLNYSAQVFVNQYSGANLIPDFEFASWPIQSAEAQAWAADKSAATPILDGIAAARGMDADKLKTAALRKALAYSALSAHVAGQRQALQSKIEAVQTLEELDKIKIEFTMPPEA